MELKICVIVLLCAGACSDPAMESSARIKAVGGSIDVRTNRADTWTALKAILEDAGFTVEVKGFEVTAGGDLPSKVVAKHKDGTKLDVELSGDTKVSIREEMHAPPGTTPDAIWWIKNTRYGEVLRRLREKVERR